MIQQPNTNFLSHIVIHCTRECVCFLVQSSLGNLAIFLNSLICLRRFSRFLRLFLYPVQASANQSLETQLDHLTRLSPTKKIRSISYLFQRLLKSTSKRCAGISKQAAVSRPKQAAFICIWQAHMRYFIGHRTINITLLLKTEYSIGLDKHNRKTCIMK